MTLAGAGAVAGLLLLRWCAQPNEYTVEHDKAVAMVLDALDAYRKQHNRYPADLRELQPAHLAKPAPFHSGVELRFASTPSRDGCWVGYMTPHTLMPSDTFIETECGTRTRRILEFGDARTTPGPGVVTFP